MTEREEDGHRTVKADHDGDVGRLVESEQLDVLEDLAAPVAGVPLYRRRPHGVGHVAEEGDDQVGDGQVKYQQVDVRFLDRSGAVRPEAQQLGDREGVSGERDQKHDAEYRRLDERHLVKLRREDIIDDGRRIGRDRFRHPGGGGGGGGSFRRFHRVYHSRSLVLFYSMESILRFARRSDYAQKEVRWIPAMHYNHVLFVVLVYHSMANKINADLGLHTVLYTVVSPFVSLELHVY